MSMTLVARVAIAFVPVATGNDRRALLCLDGRHQGVEQRTLVRGEHDTALLLGAKVGLIDLIVPGLRLRGGSEVRQPRPSLSLCRCRAALQAANSIRRTLYHGVVLTHCSFGVMLANRG